MLAAAAVPVPEGVARGVVHLTDEGRFTVPVTLVCPEFGPEDARSWVAAGDIPNSRGSLCYVAINSGHWPLITRLNELVRLLDAVIRED